MKTWGSALWLAASVAIVSVACGGALESEPSSDPGLPRQEAGATDEWEAMVGRGHGCPRQTSECRTYCKQKGHTSGRCSGYGNGNCECRDIEPAPEK